jgi:hypothetical protein
MATGGFLPKVSASPFFLGDYAENTYPNPIQAASPAASSFVMNALSFSQETDPSARQAGDIGDLIYYSTFDGPYKFTGKYTVPYAAIWNEYQYFQTRFDTFNTLKASYDTLRTAYNEAVTYSNLRNSDIMRQVLQAPKILPTRPCPPDVPSVYTGLSVSWSATPLLAAFSDAEKTAKKAVLNQGLDGSSNPTADIASTRRSGFL